MRGDAPPGPSFGYPLSTRRRGRAPAAGVVPHPTAGGDPRPDAPPVSPRTTGHGTSPRRRQSRPAPTVTVDPGCRTHPPTLSSWCAPSLSPSRHWRWMSAWTPPSPSRQVSLLTLPARRRLRTRRRRHRRPPQSTGATLSVCASRPSVSEDGRRAKVSPRSSRCACRSRSVTSRRLPGPSTVCLPDCRVRTATATRRCRRPRRRFEGPPDHPCRSGPTPVRRRSPAAPRRRTPRAGRLSVPRRQPSRACTAGTSYPSRRQ